MNKSEGKNQSSKFFFVKIFCNRIKKETKDSFFYEKSFFYKQTKAETKLNFV